MLSITETFDLFHYSYENFYFFLLLLQKAPSKVNCGGNVLILTIKNNDPKKKKKEFPFPFHHAKYNNFFWFDFGVRKKKRKRCAKKNFLGTGASGYSHICGCICLEKTFYILKTLSSTLSTAKATLNSLITVTDLQEACVLSNFQPVMRLDPDVY